jgi:predicted Zn-dependent peptidase
MSDQDRRIRQVRLANGLRVLTRQHLGPGAVGVAVNYRAGFRGEPESRSGMAHLFEHLMFQGSADIGEEGHFGYVQRLGGSVSGNTFTDVSDFHQVVPAGGEPRVLEMEADRMRNLILDQGRLDIQRKVVLEEINLKVEGVPYGGFPWTVLPSAAFASWRNGHNGYGDPEELQAVSVDECRAFYDEMYAPGNATVAVCGDIDPDSTLELAAKVFGELEDRGTPRHESLIEPAADEPRTVVRHDRLAPRPALAIGLPLPDPRDIDAYAACVVLSVALTGNGNTWLRRALGALGADAASVCGLFGPWFAADPDTFVFVAHHEPGDRAEAEALFDQGLENLADGDPAEILAARAQAYTALVGQQDSALAGARAMARSALLWDDPDLVDRAIRHTATVSADLVRDTARRFRHTRGRGYAELIPGGRS